MNPLVQKLNESWPVARWRDLTVLVAVSGGADSVALLCALVHLAAENPGEGRITAAHYNHSLRGEESDGDQTFVQQLCQSLGIECYLGQGDVSARAVSDGDGIEAAARDARYSFLLQTAEKIGARYLVTAHTSDDQVETLLHRILRGTGPGGLAGIPRVRRLSTAVSVIRPMLDITRREIEKYLVAIEQTHRTDSSNTDTAMTRNRIRHELLPWLQENFNPNVSDAVLRLGQLTTEAISVIQPLVDELIDKANVHERDCGISLDTTALTNAPRYLVRAALMQLWSAQRWPLQGMGLSDWERLAGMVDPAVEEVPAAITLPGGVEARLVKGCLKLTLY